MQRTTLNFTANVAINFDKSKNEFIVKHYSGRKIDVFHNGKFWDYCLNMIFRIC